MKLVFYSGGTNEENNDLDQLCLSLVDKINPKITYIPACSYDSEVDFYDFVGQFQRFGVQRFLYFPIDVRFDSILETEAFSSDIIHLSGGNTYYFLKWIRKNKLMKKFKEFVERGGVLTGLSAGAIMMTPNIMTASFPSFDKDDNEVNIKNLKSLNLVNFEFFPHYKNSKRYEKELVRRSKSIDVPLYACPDGSGIVVKEDETTFVGKVFSFYQGNKFLIN